MVQNQWSKRELNNIFGPELLLVQKTIIDQKPLDQKIIGLKPFWSKACMIQNHNGPKS